LNEPQPYPSLNFVEEALALGIPLTVNSDAHAPEQVGTMFDALEGFLVKRGCRQLCRFAGRQRSSYAL
jgi:histidinol-phosphatase (PHP family)